MGYFFLFPHTIAMYRTVWNKDIRIQETTEGMKLLVNGCPQAGPYMDHIWKKVFETFAVSKYCVSRLLMLGVGGGTAIQRLHGIFPAAHIDAVDIDPIMVHISKKYFGIEECGYLSYAVSDAGEFVVDALKNHVSYDYIVVDLYCGNDIPDMVYEEKFLQTIQQLGRNGMILINYLRQPDYKERISLLEQNLQKVFSSYKTYGIENNKFFFIPEA